jgi:lipopolysaccharide transport system ATP-binding protein
MTEPEIFVEHLVKSYRAYKVMSAGFKAFLKSPFATWAGSRQRFNVLNDISFRIQEGEKVAILGRNGAGKSTLLSLLAGVMKPDTGILRTQGKIAAMLELGAGMHPDLTGRENIVLNGLLLGYTRAELRDKMSDIIAFSELDGFIDTPIRFYSSGMLAKIGFSVLIFRTPEILILDEVFAVGDTHFQKKCVDAVTKFTESGDKILVLVTHDTGQAMSNCTRAIWIDEHIIKADGNAQEVCETYRRRMLS